VVPVSAASDRRLCIGRGTWQLVTLAASLRTAERAGGGPSQTTLALSGERLSEPMRRRMDAFASRLGFSDVRWIDDVVADVVRLADREVSERLRLLRARLGPGGFAELWTANPGSPLDRVVVEAFADARIVLFEDGLGTYVASWPANRNRGALLRAHARTLVTRTGRTPGRQAELLRSGIPRLRGSRRRPAAVHLLLAHELGVPAPYREYTRRVELADVRDVLELLSGGVGDAPGEDAEEPRNRTALVLAASYSFWGAMSRPDELALYARVVRSLASAGYDVLWKEHPRAVDPFLAELRRSLPDVELRAFGDDHTVPLELYLLRSSVDLLVGGTSSSLLYVPAVLGGRTRVASFAAWVGPQVGGVRQEIVRLVESRVPSLDEVLAVAQRDAAPS
jgi:hypothetical protein